MNVSKVILLLLGVVVFFAVSISAGTEDEYFGYLRTLYDSHDKDLNDFLISEFNLYQDIYTTSDNNPEAAYCIGRIHLNDKDYHYSLAGFMKLMYLYPENRFKESAVADIKNIIMTGSSYKESKEKVKTALDEIQPGGSNADRYYNYVSFLYDLEQSKLNKFALEEYYKFLVLFPDDDRVERVLRLIAGTMLADKDYESAVAAYKKYELLFPYSEHIPGVKNRQAVIKYENMKDYPGAIAALTEVIDSYPGTEYEAEAYFFRAEIKGRKLKDYQAAITDYRAVVNKMPDHPKAPDALLQMAKIAEVKLKGYNAAIVYYDEVVELYPTDQRAITALEEAARIHTKLREHNQAAAKLAQIATSFPDYEKSPAHLMSAGKISSVKMKDYKGAIGYYELVVKQYPNSKAALAADKKLVKLRQKVAW